MPHCSTHLIAPDCHLIRWQIAETEADLRHGLPLGADEAADLEKISHGGQRLEWLACRVALRQLLHSQRLTYRGLWKDAFGKPHLTDLPGHVSLSHTAGWADRKSTRLNSSHSTLSRMPSSA